MPSTARRTDEFRPSAIDPTTLVYVGDIYVGRDADIASSYAREAAAVSRELERLGAINPEDWGATKSFADGTTQEHRGCDHCGARYAYGSVFFHEPSARAVIFGHTCASKLDLEGETQAERTRSLARKEAKAAREARERAEQAQALVDAHPGLAEALTTPHRIVEDIAGKLAKFGSISPKQIALVIKLAEQVRIDRETATECPEGTVVVEGEVLSVKAKSDFDRVRLVWTVRDDRGFKVWGTVPSALVGGYGETAEDSKVGRGGRVRFTATVTRSDRDETFGFAKRPRKAEVLSEGQAWAEVERERQQARQAAQEIRDDERYERDYRDALERLAFAQRDGLVLSAKGQEKIDKVFAARAAGEVGLRTVADVVDLIASGECGDDYYDARPAAS